MWLCNKKWNFYWHSFIIKWLQLGCPLFWIVTIGRSTDVNRVTCFLSNACNCISAYPFYESFQIALCMAGMCYSSCYSFSITKEQLCKCWNCWMSRFMIVSCGEEVKLCTLSSSASSCWSTNRHGKTTYACTRISCSSEKVVSSLTVAQHIFKMLVFASPGLITYIVIHPSM